MRLSKKLLRCIFVFTFILVFKASFVFAQEENLEVFHQWIDWTDGANMLIHHLNEQAFGYLDIRDEEVSKLKSKVDWMKRQKKVKEKLMEIVEPFPEKTPLNPRITGIVKKDGYRIEKIIYESMPNFYVTGCLFIPDGIVGKQPAILNVIGHTSISFRRHTYQTLIHNLVKKGFIVFAIDPISQGERHQYYDPEKKVSIVANYISEDAASRAGTPKQQHSPALEHSYIGNQCFLSGVSLGRYFIWDGIRAIDYLLTRSEVDPERIGLTGLSGGGTQTAFIAAFDERVKAAAPSCWVTQYRRLLESRGTRDAEQNFYHGISKGITHADLLEVRAPKPALIVATTRDYIFGIQGARETYREVKRAYKAFGKEDNLEMAEDDYVHGFTKKNNEATYAFFQKALDLPGDPAQEDVEILKSEELNVTPTGQVSAYLGGETVFSLNKKETQKLLEKIEESRKNIKKHLANVKQKAKELSGYAVPDCGREPVFRGRYHRQGYSIELYALQGEGDYVIPLLLFAPDGGGRFPAVIYIHPEGKSAEASPGGQIEALVKKGFIVAAPDVINTGETKGFAEPKGNLTYPGSPGGYVAVLIGRSIVGIQAGDVIRAVNFLKNRDDVEEDQITAVAIDNMCIPLLHAAAFDDSIKKVALLGAPVSYRSIVMNKFYNFDLSFSWAVAGALTEYDLPDLAASLAPRKLILTGLKDQMKKPASEKLIEQELTFPRAVYSSELVPENLKVLSSDEDFSPIIKWCLE